MKRRCAAIDAPAYDVTPMYGSRTVESGGSLTSGLRLLASRHVFRDCSLQRRQFRMSSSNGAGLYRSQLQHAHIEGQSCRPDLAREYVAKTSSLPRRRTMAGRPMIAYSLTVQLRARVVFIRLHRRTRATASRSEGRRVRRRDKHVMGCSNAGDAHWDL